MTTSAPRDHGPADGAPVDHPQSEDRATGQDDGRSHGDSVERVVDSVGAPEDGRARGMQTLLGERFSIADAVGGVRGMIESVAPGLVFVVAYVVTRDLTIALVSSVVVTLVAIVVRLVQRTPVTQALAGLLGVVIGVVWAWRSGNASDFFVWGLWTNAIYLVVLLVSLLVRWPLVGVVVEAFRSGFATGPAPEESADGAGSSDTPASEDPVARPDHEQAAGDGEQRAAFAQWAHRWRSDRALVRRYAAATWLWIALFAVRLAVQVPLYTEGAVGWLGTARLVMGLPLWALVLWLTWAMVRQTSDLRSQGEDTVPRQASSGS